MPRVFFKDIDKGFSKYIASLKEQSKGHVRVGIQGEKALQKKKTFDGKLDDELDVVSVATFNEFGTPTIPERSFLRATVDKNRKKIGDILEAGLTDIKRGRLEQTQALSFLGLWLQARIVERINAGIAPANAPSTIARKGSSKPLVASGQLGQSVTYVVDLRSSTHKNES